MKDKLLKDIIEWYDSHDDKNNIFIEKFIEEIIDKTTDAVLDEVKIGLKDEFIKGNLQHPFIISDDYYLYLKLKEIKNSLLHPDKDIDFTENDKIK
jgi:hypothetical protein